MLIQETYINATNGYMIGESDKYEPFTDDTGKLFKFLQREYGRCVSKVYIDRDGASHACGWVFQKNRQYEDAPETYLQEVWVSLYEKEDKVERTTFPLFIA